MYARDSSSTLARSIRSTSVSHSGKRLRPLACMRQHTDSPNWENSTQCTPKEAGAGLGVCVCRGGDASCQNTHTGSQGKPREKATLQPRNALTFHPSHYLFGRPLANRFHNQGHHQTTLSFTHQKEGNKNEGGGGKQESGKQRRWVDGRATDGSLKAWLEERAGGFHNAVQR